MLNATHVFDFFGISDIGLVREHNEDVWVAYPESGLFLLADGMGGHAAGEVAAKESIDFLSDLIKEWRPSSDLSLEEIEAFFKEAVRATNRHIYQMAASFESLTGMGTTVCLLCFMQKNAIMAHVGDSRIYRYRSFRLTQMTEDHSLVSEMLAMGVIDSQDKKNFPYKHILTRAIGSHPEVEPTVSLSQTQEKELYLICSDGLTNYVKDDQIKRVLAKSTSLEKKGHELVDLAKENGGGDNITCILIRCP